MRVKVQPYGISKSARTLAEFLEVLRLKVTGSKFKARQGDVIVNWGVVKLEHPNAIYLNDLNGVKAAANKLQTLNILKEAGVSIPVFFTNKKDLGIRTKYFARTTLSGHSGQGIVVGTPKWIPEAPLYTKQVKKANEYRAIVVGGKVVDFKQKLKKKDFEGERCDNVWNHGNGYIFARNNIKHPEEADNQAIAALKALNLNYAAVDLIEDAKGKIYVLEVNTAFGLEGSTTALVGEAIKELICTHQK